MKSVYIFISKGDSKKDSPDFGSEKDGPGDFDEHAGSRPASDAGQETRHEPQISGRDSVSLPGDIAPDQSGSREIHGSAGRAPSQEQTPQPGGRRSSYFDRLAQKHRTSNPPVPAKGACCKDDSGIPVTKENIDEIRKKLEASSRRKPVNVMCGSANCTCAYHYLKDGKLNCVKVKSRSGSKQNAYRENSH